MTIRVFSFIVTPASNTPLANLAGSLSLGASSSALGDSGFTLGDIGGAKGPLHGIQWQNVFYYDAANARAVMLSKSENTTARSPVWLSRYNATTNTWSASEDGSDPLGHVYESVAYDPATPRVFNGDWAAAYIKYANPTVAPVSWAQSANTPSSVALTDSVQPAMAWHPNAFGSGQGGLMVMNGRSTAGSILCYRPSNNSWATVNGSAWTYSGSNSAAYIGTLRYIAGGDYVMAVCFTDNSNMRTIKIPAGSGGTTLGTATVIANPPIPCTYCDQSGSNIGVILDNPHPTRTDSAYILEKAGSRRVWKWNGAAWSQLSGVTHPFQGYANGSTAWTCASCYPHNVFWAKGYDTTTSLIWKPNS